MKLPIHIDDIRAASERIRSRIHETPVLDSRSINAAVGSDCVFKCENFQRTGSFKFRGACNAVFSLSGKDAGKGVVTHSSGNHAAALALAAGERGIHADIVMPEKTLSNKIRAVESYRGRIIFCRDTLEAREKTTTDVVSATGAIFIHPSDDPLVMAGQGTAALELAARCPDLDAVLAPVGGGGLLSGTATVVKALYPRTAVYGCEPEKADDAFRSLRSGTIVKPQSPDTIADGLRTALGVNTFHVIQKTVDDILLVPETAIVDAMQLLFERMKIVVEPSGAVSLAAVLTHRDRLARMKLGIILSGGNADLNAYWHLLRSRMG